MASVHETFIISMGIILIGVILKQTGFLGRNETKALAKVIFNSTLPALILITISTIKITAALAMMPFFAIVFGISLMIFSTFLFKKTDPSMKGLLLMPMVGFNVGNFAYPLVEGIWGTTGLQYIAMFDIGNAMVIFILSYSVGAIYSPVHNQKLQNNEEKRIIGEKINTGKMEIPFKAILKKISKSLPLIAYFIALGLNYINFQFTGISYNILNIIASANRGIVLLVLGLSLSLKFEKEYWKTIGKIIVVRYSFGMVIGALIFYFLPIDRMAAALLWIGFILPVGMATITFAVEFDYDERFIGTLANLTMIISFFLMWALAAYLTPLIS